MFSPGTCDCASAPNTRLRRPESPCTVIVRLSLPLNLVCPFLFAGNALIDIVDVNGKLGSKGGAAPGKAGNNLDHFCLQIEPFDETELITYLQSHGIEPGKFQERNGAQGMGLSLYISDIDGNTPELRAQTR